MGKSFVITGAHDGEIVHVLRGVRKQVGHLYAGLTVLFEGALGAEDYGVAKFAVLKIFVAEAVRRMLAVQFRQQRFWIVGVHLAGAALHEEGDDTLGAGGQRRLFGRERVLAVRRRGAVLLEHVHGGKPTDPHTGILQEAATRISRHK